jgi:multiple sugar transport system ATP-binding protein
MMGIPDLLERKPGELSGGQQQRVALGRAIVRDPEVFLLDEPLSNLDAKLRAHMRTELQRIQEELGVTTMYVTHDQTEAMTMGDRIAILDAGKLQQIGTPLECYHQPANLFVAGFLGEPAMNFFEMAREDGRLVGEGVAYPLSEETRTAIGPDADRVTIGVRPEDVAVRDRAEGDHDFPATVDVVEPMGDTHNVYLRFEDGGEDAFVATVSGRRRIEGGEEVVVRIPEDAIHLFDGETGEALRNRNLDAVEELEPRA